MPDVTEIKQSKRTTSSLVYTTSATCRRAELGYRGISAKQVKQYCRNTFQDFMGGYIGNDANRRSTLLAIFTKILSKQPTILAKGENNLYILPYVVQREIVDSTRLFMVQGIKGKANLGKVQLVSHKRDLFPERFPDRDEYNSYPSHILMYRWSRNSFHQDSQQAGLHYLETLVCRVCFHSSCSCDVYFD
jgi:hypothetical protein